MITNLFLVSSSGPIKLILLFNSLLNLSFAFEHLFAWWGTWGWAIFLFLHYVNLSLDHANYYLKVIIYKNTKSDINYFDKLGINFKNKNNHKNATFEFDNKKIIKLRFGYFPYYDIRSFILFYLPIFSQQNSLIPSLLRQRSTPFPSLPLN
mgnify:FL=1